MYLVVDTLNPASVGAAHTFLSQLLPGETGAPGEPVEARLAEYVWSHVGLRMKKLLAQIWQHPGLDYTQEALAGNLARSPASVRSSMNSGLRRVELAGKLAIPGAPDLFVWRQNAQGIWEFGMSDAIKEAFRSDIEFFLGIAIPKAR